MLKISIRRFIRKIIRKHNKNFWPVVILCLIGSAIIIMATLYAETMERNNFRRQLDMDTLHMLTMVRSKLGNDLSKDLLKLEAMVAYISVNPKISLDDFNIFARNMLRRKADIISYGIAPDMVVKYVYPLAGNEAAVGLDYRKLPTQRHLAFLARDTGERVMAGPLISAQGRYVLMARAPVYLTEEAGERFWGLVSVLIDAKKLFKSIADQSKNYKISLRAKDTKGHAGEVFFGDPRSFATENITLSIPVPGGSWQLSAVPRSAGHFLPLEIRLIRFAGLGLLLVIITFFIFRIRYMQERTLTGKQLEIALIAAEKANRAKSEFLANMSHELRTPLNVILGFSDLICDISQHKITREKVTEYAHDIHDSGRHLLGIINDILDLSKVESGNFTITIEDVYLQDVVEQSLRLVRNSLSKAELTAVTDIADDLQPFPSDERILRQIFLNLLSNAIKFTPKGGRITLSAQALENGTMKIILTDSGRGMSKEDLKIALQPFGQVDSSLVRTQQGTGLGLPLVKAFVELLDGDFTIQSEIGVGTEITLTFPLA